MLKTSIKTASVLAAPLLAALGLAILPRAAAAQPAPADLSLGYDARLYFIKVLDLQFQQHIGVRDFTAGAQLRSYGVLAAFKRFDIRAQASGRMTGEGPQPQAFDYVNHDGKRTRHVIVAWSPGDVAMTSTPRFGDLGDPPASLEQRLGAADPLTQLMRATVAQPGQPCQGEPRFFDGKQYYGLDFSGAHAEAPNDGERGLGVTSVVACSMRYVPLAGFKKPQPGKPRGGLNAPIRVAFGQLGPRGPWVMAEIKADTPLGPAYIVLAHARITPGQG